jgi:hypothetical protein
VKATEDRQRTSVDAAGALDAAINTLRFTGYVDPSVPCPLNPTAGGPADALRVPASAGSSADELVVTCEGVPGTGTAGAVVPITARNRPGSAVLTLGTGGEAGLSKGSNGVLSIRGRVYVNSDISVSGSACPGTNCSQVTVADAPVTARTGCTAGRVVTTSTTAATYPVNCTSSGSPPEGLDPALLTDTLVPPNPATGHPGGDAVATGYAQPPSTVADLVHRVVPATCPTGNPVFFDPGYYDNVRALNDLMNGGCSRTYVFRPGTYYFDFRDEEVDALASSLRPFTPAASNVWNITDPNTYVIGGTRTGTTLPPSIPGACVSPLTSVAADQGVKFVFGGSSRLDVNGGKVELCGQYTASSPPIALYGARTGTTAAVPVASFVASTATGQVATGVTFTPAAGTSAAAQLAAPGGTASTVTITRLSGSATRSGTWRLTGVNPGIPRGSILTQADVEVVHRETSFRNGDAYSVAVTANPGRPGASLTDTTSVVARSPTTPPTWSTDTADLRAGLVQEVWRHGLDDLRLDLSAVARGGPGSTPPMVADVDAVLVRLAWQPPSLRGGTANVNGANCVGAVGGCALLTTSGSQTRLYFQGTVYAPLARLDVSLTNISGQVFRSGLVARALSVDVTASSSYTGAVIEIPDDTLAGVSLETNLVAYRCPVPLSSGACAGAASPPGGSWQVAGKARVAFESTYPAPTTGRRKVTVIRWQLL